MDEIAKGVHFQLVDILVNYRKEKCFDVDAESLVETLTHILIELSDRRTEAEQLAGELHNRNLDYEIAAKLIVEFEARGGTDAANGVRLLRSHLNENGYVGGWNKERQLIAENLALKCERDGRSGQAKGIKRLADAIAGGGE